MRSSSDDDRTKIWDLIKNAHSALFVGIAADGSFDSRPMGCLQTEFDGTLWFLTFHHSHKINELSRDSRVLVSYAKPVRFRVCLNFRSNQLGR